MITSDKSIISFSHVNQTLWPVYIIIDNLDAKTWQNQTCLGNLFLDLILIVYERAKDSNNKDKNLKAKVYYSALKAILKRMIRVFNETKL